MILALMRVEVGSSCSHEDGSGHFLLLCKLEWAVLAPMKVEVGGSCSHEGGSGWLLLF